MPVTVTYYNSNREIQILVETHKRRVSIMSVINELIRTEANGTLSFGNYSLAAKSKVEDFEHEGDLYKVKTFKEITKLERNGMFVQLKISQLPIQRLPSRSRDSRMLRLRYSWRMTASTRSTRTVLASAE